MTLQEEVRIDVRAHRGRSNGKYVDENYMDCTLFLHRGWYFVSFWLEPICNALNSEDVFEKICQHYYDATQMHQIAQGRFTYDRAEIRPIHAHESHIPVLVAQAFRDSNAHNLFDFHNARVIMDSSKIFGTIQTILHGSRNEELVIDFEDSASSSGPRLKATRN